jgi:hypothetical protein
MSDVHSMFVSYLKPKMELLRASIDERQQRIDQLRSQKNHIEDTVFTEFCQQIHVANIR